MSDTPETDALREAIDNGAATEAEMTSLAGKFEAERDQAREALRDMLSGWKYIRQVHGDLYGVGWDRAQIKAETALEVAQ